MAKFISIPTQVVGEPNILFNTDNITTVLPPTSGDVAATGLYFTIWTEAKAIRLTLGGSSAAIRNANAIAAAKIVQNTITSANIAPVSLPVIFPSVLLSAGAGATAQTTITVASTAGLSVGMVVTVISGQGAFALNTTISSITNATQFVVSAAPTTTLAGAGISAAVLTITNAVGA
jgi:hypothetical protein